MPDPVCGVLRELMMALNELRMYEGSCEIEQSLSCCLLGLIIVLLTTLVILLQSAL